MQNRFGVATSSIGLTVCNKPATRLVAVDNGIAERALGSSEASPAMRSGFRIYMPATSKTRETGAVDIISKELDYRFLMVW